LAIGENGDAVCLWKSDSDSQEHISSAMNYIIFTLHFSFFKYNRNPLFVISFPLQQSIFGRPFVQRFALCYRSVVLSCLSVTFVHCGQTVGRIKTKLGMPVGLGPGHIVLDGDPALPPQRGTAPPPIFGPYLLRPNGSMD